MGRIAVVFVGYQLAGIHLSGVVQGVPWLRHQIRRMRICETGPAKEGLIARDIVLDPGDRAICCPYAVVKSLGQFPFPFPLLSRTLLQTGSRIYLLKEISPVRQAMLFHPDRVMLPCPGFIRMIAIGFDVVKPIPWCLPLIESPPEVQVMQIRMTFNAADPATRIGPQRLKMRLANQCRIVACTREVTTHRGHIFRQFASQAPASMHTWVHPRDQACTGRAARRIRAISPIKPSSLPAQPVERGGLKNGVDRPEHRMMLLVAGDKQNIRAESHYVDEYRKSAGDARWKPYPSGSDSLRHHPNR